MKRLHYILLSILAFLIFGMCAVILWILLFRQSDVPKLMTINKTTPPSTQQIADSVSKYLIANPIINGVDGPPPTPSQITNSVSNYLKTNPPATGDVRGDTGKSGTNGINGANGSSCSAKQADIGATITCTDGSSAVLNNGSSGADGKTPDLQCNEIANRWEIRYSSDDNWTLLSNKVIPCVAKQ